MRQFDVVANPAGRLRRLVPYLVILQSHYLIEIETTIVAPLVVRSSLPPDFVFALPVALDGTPFTLAVHLSSVPTKRLGRSLGTLGLHDLEIARALERLFSGF